MRIKGNTVKINKSTSRFAEASKTSIKKDFQNTQQKRPEPKKPEIKTEIEPGVERRVIQISEKGDYAKYHRHIVGKLVRLVRKSMHGGWYCEFVFDDDRKALNQAAGWSDRKKEYLFDGLKFK